ncbi:LysR family transcriptional regulator [Eubacteriales bacterium OttesenSCG-928-K08]|nr:LysR family transcriptional regulator [Eubacteriales bacterium OttesenSCG-928-K08]
MQLSNFQVLAKMQHMTHAADALHIAQSALSRSLKKLEEELGVQLFDRVGKYISLNECGQIFLRHVDVMLSEFEDAKLELNEQQGKGKQSAALSMYAGSKLLPEIVRGFKDKYPDISLQVMQQGSTYESIVSSDITVYSSINSTDEADTLVLMEESICLALPSNHPLAQKASIKLLEAANEPFICLHKGKGLREITDELCRQAGFTPNIVLESDSPGTVRDLVSVGVGFTFVPKISWPGMGDDPNVTLVEIEEPVCSRFVIMKCRRERHLTGAALKLKEYLVDYFLKKSLSA